MQISPIKYSLIKAHNSQNRIGLNDTANVDLQRDSRLDELSNLYYQPINFQHGLRIVFVKEMQALKGVRCPICNTKMLNQEELNKAFSEISEIVTGENLLEFINKYRENINGIFDDLINKRLADTIKNSPETNAFEILLNLRPKMMQSTDNQLKVLAGTLLAMSVADDTPLEARKLLKYGSKKVSSLKDDVSRFSYNKHLSLILRNALGAYSGKEYNQRYRALIGEAQKKIIEERLFHYTGTPDESVVEAFCKKILIYSKADLRKVYFKEDATQDNMVLSCGMCEVTNQKLIFSMVQNKENYYEYIYDMARRVLDGELPNSKAYPIELSENVRQRSMSIVPDISQPHLSALYNDLDRKPTRRVDFPLVDERGITCAYCGQETVTHEEKLELYQKIASAQSIPEMWEVVNNRREVIKSRYLPILRYFDNLGDNLYKVKESKLLPNMRKMAWKNIQEQLFTASKNLNKISSDFQLAGEDKTVVNNIVKLVDKYMLMKIPSNAIFPLPEYKEELYGLASHFNDRLDIRGAIWKACYAPIVDCYQVQQVLAPLESVSQKLGSEVKAVLQTLFKRSVATVDHMDPKINFKLKKENPEQYNSYLRDRSSNLVVACKECNIKKGGSPLRLFVANKGPSVVFHFREYLKRAKTICSIKNIKYSTYEVAANFKKLTDREL